MLRCADGTLYVGRTGDLELRLADHAQSRGSMYTASRRPVTLVYQEAFETDSAAAARERQLKCWTSAKKEALIRGDSRALHRLSTRRRFEKKPRGSRS